MEAGARGLSSSGGGGGGPRRRGGSRGGRSTIAVTIVVTSPAIAYQPKLRRARLSEKSSDPYPTIEVQEQRATAGPTSASESRTSPRRSRTRAATFAP